MTQTAASQDLPGLQQRRPFELRRGRVFRASPPNRRSLRLAHPAGKAGRPPPVSVRRQRRKPHDVGRDDGLPARPADSDRVCRPREQLRRRRASSRGRRRSDPVSRRRHDFSALAEARGDKAAGCGGISETRSFPFLPPACSSTTTIDARPEGSSARTATSPSMARDPVSGGHASDAFPSHVTVVTVPDVALRLPRQPGRTSREAAHRVARPRGYRGSRVRRADRRARLRLAQLRERHPQPLRDVAGERRFLAPSRVVNGVGVSPVVNPPMAWLYRWASELTLRYGNAVLDGGRCSSPTGCIRTSSRRCVANRWSCCRTNSARTERSTNTACASFRRSTSRRRPRRRWGSPESSPTAE